MADSEDKIFITYFFANRRFNIIIWNLCKSCISSFLWFYNWYYFL